MSSRKSIIPKSWNVSPVIRRRVGEDAGRQRLMLEDGEVFVILHLVPSAEDKGMREPATFWCDKEGNWKSSPSSGGRSEFKTLLKNYQNRIAGLDSILETAEEPEEIHQVIDEATPVVRAGRHLTQVLGELRKALSEDLDILSIRDQAVNMERSGDLLLQDAKSSLEFLIAKNAADQAKEAQKAAEEAKKLNRLAAFFFPLMTLAAVLGINDPRTMLSNGAIWGVVAIGLLLGVFVSAIVKQSK